jgi:hypothetical protein
VDHQRRLGERRRCGPRTVHAASHVSHRSAVQAGSPARFPMLTPAALSTAPDRPTWFCTASSGCTPTVAQRLC